MHLLMFFLVQSDLSFIGQSSRWCILRTLSDSTYAHFFTRNPHVDSRSIQGTYTSNRKSLRNFSIGRIFISGYNQELGSRSIYSHPKLT